MTRRLLTLAAYAAAAAFIIYGCWLTLEYAAAHLPPAHPVPACSAHRPGPCADEP